MRDPLARLQLKPGEATRIEINQIRVSITRINTGWNLHLGKDQPTYRIRLGKDQPIVVGPEDDTEAVHAILSYLICGCLTPGPSAEGPIRGIAGILSQSEAYRGGITVIEENADSITSRFILNGVPTKLTHLKRSRTDWLTSQGEIKNVDLCALALLAATKAPQPRPKPTKGKPYRGVSLRTKRKRKDCQGYADFYEVGSEAQHVLGPR